MNVIERSFVISMAVGVLLGAMTVATATGEGLTRVGRRDVSAEQASREQAVMQAAGIENWPTSQRVRGAPAVDKSVLSKADLVTSESRSYDVVVLDKTECGKLWITWRQMVPSEAPPPAELPAGIRAQLEKATEGLAPDARQRHLDKALARYRRSRAMVERGAIKVKMIVAPSSRAAQEYLIYESTQCSLPTRVVAAHFDESKKLAGVGDVAFKHKGTVRFVRDNVAVILYGYGEFVEEAERLAKKLDAAIAKKPALGDFDASCPNVRVGSLRNEAVAAPGQPACSFSTTPPSGGAIASVQATVNGEPAPVKDREILLGSTKGKVKVKVTAIADSLLVASAEKTVVVSGE